MKALVKAKRRFGLWLDDVAMPVMGEHDVLIQVKKTSICGTDVHIYDWDDWARATIPVPMTIGHEFFGEVADIGSAVTGLTVGQLVSGEGHIVCWQCHNCRTGVPHLCAKTLGLGVKRPGCFAEYVVLPSVNVIPLPNDLPHNVASVLDPLGNAVHCATSFPLAGEDVLITGAGPIGLMMVAVVKHLGANRIVITDVNDYRLNMAQTMGATLAVNIQQASLQEAMSALHLKEGFSIGFEMSGQTSAWHDLLGNMAFGGKVAILGIPTHPMKIDWNHVIFKGLTLKGIYGREMFATWDKMLAMLQSGLDISSVITHEFAMEEYQHAFELMHSGQSGKVILNWK